LFCFILFLTHFLLVRSFLIEIEAFVLLLFKKLTTLKQ
jgi:hypothetical protein